MGLRKGSGWGTTKLTNYLRAALQAMRLPKRKVLPQPHTWNESQQLVSASSRYVAIPEKDIVSTEVTWL